ncbi:lauroyl-Kdo(2)-lipid IV(A) myristoyltransferase [Photobacterium galatheae]|uniref:Lipid A biosynthesis acyltransferase n=1 Tax=Photobacterium galatheae TaxID=1654360 RepID=A0A066RJR3_9GAMM|nr:lauroyl-Kdo(2)-lipid IV(A) myristoyltransferase [Photobacterium galatheae]KDM90655.1 hypothetical protein EA58_16230 [Photobacterium galatheae]
MTTVQNRLSQDELPPGYHPTFQWSFLHPRHWGTWISIFFLGLFALLPWRIRDRIAGFVGLHIGRRVKKSRHRARVNLTLCFPELSETEREAKIDQMYSVASQVVLAMGELLFRSRKHLQQRTQVFGQEHLDKELAADKSVIILVPHCWAIDFPAIFWASLGLPVVGLIKPQHRQPVFDWLISCQRLQYGGICYARDGGLKPYIRAIKSGFLGYYLPDEDFGPEQSQFTDFFATKKATFSGLGKIAKLTNASVIPMIPVYNTENGKFEIHISPVLNPLPGPDAQHDANLLAEALEKMVAPYQEQYMWNLQLLKTRPDGSKPY